MSDEKPKALGKFHDVWMLGIGFLLTTAAGSAITCQVQSTAARRELEARRFDSHLQRATQVYEEITRLMAKQLSAQITTNNLATDLAADYEVYSANGVHPDKEQVDTDSTDVRESIKDYNNANREWMDGRYRLAPLVAMYFGARSAADLQAVVERLSKVAATLFQRTSDVAQWQVSLRKPDLFKSHTDTVDAALRSAEGAVATFTMGAGDQIRKLSRAGKLD